MICHELPCTAPCTAPELPHVTAPVLPLDHPMYCLPVLPQVTPNEIYLVVNAGCREKDLEHIGKHLQAAKVRTHVCIRT
jgi:hypothetical protein